VNNNVLEAVNLNLYYGKHLAVEGFNYAFAGAGIYALIGPSGCGKTTTLRSFNRMHEETKNARIEGTIRLNGKDLNTMDPIIVRQKVGMVFQKATPFPHLSISDNVLIGHQLNNGAKPDDLVEQALIKVGLWHEVKDKLGASGASLSGGQQQRLCIARATVLEPDILLMDEPCSALDPRSTLKIEELMKELALTYTVVLVTHNLQQAGRVAHQVLFMLADDYGVGHLIEAGPKEKIFNNPEDTRTRDYVTGLFG